MRRENALEEPPHIQPGAGRAPRTGFRLIAVRRSPEPVLRPEASEERQGAVANVVFPSGIDRRDDLDEPDRFGVYYGMADDWIGVARLDLPGYLPLGAPADHPEGQV
jgi:hypothetical protein